MPKQRIKKAPPRKAEVDSDEDTSTSSEEEPEWTKDHEAAFLKTLGALKSNTSTIYNDDVKFWDQEKLEQVEGQNIGAKSRKHVPMFLRDYERKVILEKQGKIEESDDEEEEIKHEPSYYEQQEEIRRKIKATIANINDDEEDLLVKRTKSTAETAAEEEDYYEWLKKQDADGLPQNNELAGLKKAWNDSSLADDDKFLRDYLLNKDYITDEKNNGIPAYEDIVDPEEDEEDLKKQRNYEAKYNFRFEDPDQQFIKQYPRSVNESLREGNAARKLKREKYKERKAEEKEVQKKEIAQKKLSTKKFIEARLKALRDAGGEDIPVRLEDLQEDFDPKKFDDRMKELFEEKYYSNDQDFEEDKEMKKPVFSDIEDNVENAKMESEESDLMVKDGEEEFEEVKESAVKKPKKDPEAVNEEPHRRKESRRKQKRAAAAIKTEKPIFDPNEKTFEEYLKEYYSLDYEDIIGDQPTKFKYRQVIPNDFGLGVGEILDTDDSQLNQWVSLRKVTSYRPEQEEKHDVKVYQRIGSDVERKKRILSDHMKVGTLLNKKKPKEKQEVVSEQPSSEKTKKKRSKTKKKVVEAPLLEVPTEEPKTEKVPRRRKKPQQNGIATKKPVAASQPSKTPTSQQKTKRPAKKALKKLDKIDDDRLLAYGINPKKYKQKLKYGVKTSAQV